LWAGVKMENAAEFRARADRIRWLAHRASNEIVRLQLLVFALDYEERADDIERSARQRPHLRLVE
jgi:hypothetical protein